MALKGHLSGMGSHSASFEVADGVGSCDLECRVHASSSTSSGGAERGGGVEGYGGRKKERRGGEKRRGEERRGEEKRKERRGVRREGSEGRGARVTAAMRGRSACPAGGHSGMGMVARWIRNIWVTQSATHEGAGEWK